jgi:hypothetical protein
MTLFPALAVPEPFDRFSPCRFYRYELGHLWDSRPPLVVCGINPSIATAARPDPTKTRVIGFARDGGFGGWVLVNPFAAVSTNVRGLSSFVDPIGPENDAHLLKWATRGTFVCAWGPPTKVPAALRCRLDAVVGMLVGAGARLHVLRLTKDGHPEHPLMLPKTCRPMAWSPT